MADDLIHVRIDPTTKKRIESLVKEGKYDSVSSFVNESIRNNLDPHWKSKETEDNITYLINTSPEFREKLKRVLQ